MMRRNVSDFATYAEPLADERCRRGVDALFGGERFEQRLDRRAAVPDFEDAMQQDSRAAFLRPRRGGRATSPRGRISGSAAGAGRRRLDDRDRRQLRFERGVRESAPRAHAGAFAGDAFECDRNRVAADRQHLDDSRRVRPARRSTTDSKISSTYL